MTALTKDVATSYRTGTETIDPVTANVKIYAGALVVLDAAGNARNGITGTNLIARGVAQHVADNTGGSAGAITVKSRRGVFLFNNDGSINRTHIGKLVYIVDDQTLAASNGGNTRSEAGKCIDVESGRVWVEIK